MELDQDKIHKIGNFLNLKKIIVKQKIQLLLYPNEKTEDFDEKLEFLKSIFKNVTFRTIEEGELNVKSIVSGQS